MSEMILTSMNDVKISDALNIAFLIFLHILGINFSVNSLNSYNLKSCGWDKQVMWMG